MEKDIPDSTEGENWVAGSFHGWKTSLDNLLNFERYECSAFFKKKKEKRRQNTSISRLKKVGI